jgi:hypothetical protein
MQKFYPTITTEIAWTLLYNLVAQDSFSAAAYWNGELPIELRFNSIVRSSSPRRVPQMGMAIHPQQSHLQSSK